MPRHNVYTHIYIYICVYIYVYTHTGIYMLCLCIFVSYPCMYIGVQSIEPHELRTTLASDTLFNTWGFRLGLSSPGLDRALQLARPWLASDPPFLLCFALPWVGVGASLAASFRAHKAPASRI